MSFVNLLADDIWTEGAIARRCEAMLDSEFPPPARNALSDKVLGATIGEYTMTPEDTADLERYRDLRLAVRDAGRAARDDAILLGQVMAHEAAMLASAEGADPVGPPDENSEIFEVWQARAVARGAPPEA